MSEEYKITAGTISGGNLKGTDIEPSIVVGGKRYTASEFNKAVEMLKQPTLNENQQIILKYMKHDYKEFDNQSPIEVPISLFESFECGYLSDEEQLAFESLTEKQEAETIRAFMDWFLEQEEENGGE